MIKSAESTAKNTAESEILIHTPVIKKSFGQVPRWLLFKMFQKLPAREHFGWCLLAYLICLKPDTVINIKELSERSGYSERSLYLYMGYLAEVGHVKITKIRGDDARFITTIYEVFYHKFSWKNTNTNLQKGDFKEENSKNENDNSRNYLKSRSDEKNNTNTNLQKGENTDENHSSYNKNTPAHASNNNTRNNTVSKETKISGSENQSGPRKNSNPPSPLSGADLFCYYLTSKERQTLSKGLINTAGKFIPDNEIRGVIERSRINGDQVKYLNGVIKNKRNDTQPRQYQTRPQSEQAPPAKPQKDMAEQDGKQIVQQFAEIDSKFESFIENLSTKEQIELIEKIKPNLSQFTIRRLGIQNNISEDLLEYYFINYQVRSEIVAYYELL